MCKNLKTTTIMKLLQKIILTVALFGTVSIVYSSNFELTGLVTNVQTNEPIAEHIVYIAPLTGTDTIATTTDAEGYFYKKVKLDDSGMFLGSVITIDPCSGEMNYQVLAVEDSTYFVEFQLCGNFGGECSAMFEYYNGISSVVIGGEDSLPAEDYTVHFVNVSSQADSYLWNFGDSTTSIEENPVHVFPHSGSYEVSLTITSDSCESSYATSVWVDEPYPVDCYTWFSYSYGADSVYIENDSVIDFANPLEVRFYDYSMQENENWKWSFGDGATSTEKNPVHVYEKPGVYFVTLEAGNNDCSSISEQTLILETPGAECYAAIEYVVGEYVGDDSSGVSGFQVEFIDVSAGNPNSWRWDFGDGVISNEQNPVHYYQQPGIYNIVLFAGNDSCFSTAYSWVTVIGNGGPDSICMADFIVEYQDCIGDSINNECMLFPIMFHNISMGSFNEWYWDFGDGETSAEQSPLHIYEAGEYEVKLKAFGSECEAEFYQYISINAIPIDTVWYPESCLAMFYPLTIDEHTVEFVNESYGEIDSYYWDFGDGTSSTEEHPVHTYNDIDEWYLVSLTIASADSCTSTYVMELWLNDYESNESLRALFIPEINGNQVVFHNQSVGEIKNYHWDFGDGATLDSIEAVHEYNELGTYIVTLGISNDEAVTTFTMEIDLVNSTFKGMSNYGATNVSKTHELVTEISVYPNPVSEQATVNVTSKDASVATIQILSITGQTIMQKQVELVQGENNFSVNTALLKQGVYILNVVSQKQNKSFKINK